MVEAPELGEDVRTCDLFSFFQSFLWDDMLVRVSANVEHHGRELTLEEGMRPSEFLARLLDYLQLQLGVGDFHDLARQLKKFSDFNEDGKVALWM